MPIIYLREKDDIERFLRRNIPLHLYGIGDLDDFFWPYTSWQGLTVEGELQAVSLLYTGQTVPTLLALTDRPAYLKELLSSILAILPSRFYAHLSPGLDEIFRSLYGIVAHGEHYKMVLEDVSEIIRLDCSHVNRLSVSDLNEINRLYAVSYAGNWFDRRMLEIDQYFGIRVTGGLVSIAGVHVYSKAYGVAALGNITTHPSWRNRGYGTQATARLCQSLLETVDVIGLNVKADNKAAISCYENLGFEIIATYGEFTMNKREKK